MVTLTGDEKNFYRISRILLDDVVQQLRAEFKARFQARFGRVWGDDPQSGAFFLAKCAEPQMSSHIKNVIMQGDTAKFETTVLMACLLFSGTGILLPTPRRRCRAQPFTDSERIDELRHMRNILAHAVSSSISSADFNCKLTSLREIYAQLNWDSTLMTKLAHDPVVSEECTRLKDELEVERQRIDSHDEMLQEVAGR